MRGSIIMPVCPKPHPLAVYKELDGYLILSRLNSEEFLLLKGLGARVFRLADGSKSVGNIIHLIAEEFQLPLSDARQEVADSIQEMMIHKLLVIEDVAEASSV
jgi:hypothetical protein